MTSCHLTIYDSESQPLSEQYLPTSKRRSLWRWIFAQRIQCAAVGLKPKQRNPLPERFMLGRLDCGRNAVRRARCRCGASRRLRASKRKWTGGRLGSLQMEGQEGKMWGFTFTLGHSRRMVADAALEQKLGTLLRMHEEACR